MDYRKIFFPIGGGDELEERIKGALLISKYFNAHLEILMAQAKPSDIMKFDKTLSDSLLRDLNSLADRQLQEDLHKHEKIFDKIVGELKIEKSDTYTPDIASAYVNNCSGYRSDLIEENSKYCDLVVIASPPNGNVTATFETTISKSGKPALMFPRVMTKFETNKIIIGWNNSPEVSRAVSLGIDIMKNASEVHIVTAKEYTKDLKELEKLQDYLMHHGIKSTCEMVETTRIPGEALLREANAGNYDMIIAGAFGHKGLRELMLGGTTKYILEHTTIPVFMSH